MEKRLILAMFLIFLTTMVWYMTITPPPKTPPPGSFQVTDEAVIEEDEQSQEVHAESAPSGQAGEVHQEPARSAPTESLLSFDTDSPGYDILVETGTMIVTFHTKGAVMTSCVLKDFKGYHNGERVEYLPLIPDDVTSKNLAVKFPVNGQQIDFSQVNFATNKDQINLTNGNSESDTLQFVAAWGDQRFIISYVFFPDKYSFEYDLNVENIELSNENFTIYWNTGLNNTEKDIKYDEAYVAGMSDQMGEVLTYDLKKINKQDGQLRENKLYRWVGVKTHYFAFIISALNTDIKTVGFQTQEEEVRVGVDWSLPANTIQYNNHDFEIYLGPQDYNILKEYHRNWEKIVDFGWNWIEPLSRFMLLIFIGLYKVVPHYGMVIVIFSLLIKVIFYPLMQKQLKSMQAMQEVQPQMNALKEKYKDDPNKLNKEMIKLYQEHKINPVSGCLPLLIQMPIFIALYNVLRTTIYLRDASFLWIPDLSQNPEVTVLGVILPLAMGASMFLQQKMSTSTAANQQQKMMMYMLPVVFTFFSFQWSTGLILYWFIQNLTTIMQQFFINKAKKKEEGDV